MADAARVRLTLDDVVAGAFAQSGLSDIPSSPKILQRFFYEVAQRSDLPEDIERILRRLHFQVTELFPFSRELEASLIRLQIGGLVSAMNPDYEKFTMSSPQKAKIEARLKNLPTEDCIALKEIGEALRAA